MDAFRDEPLDILGNVVRDPDIACFAFATGGVLTADLEEPTLPRRGPPETVSGRVSDLVGAKTTPAHELDGDLALPVLAPGDSLEMGEFLVVRIENTLCVRSAVVGDPNNSRLYTNKAAICKWLRIPYTPLSACSGGVYGRVV